MNNLDETAAKVWRFFGIPRSGNHAIIEWIVTNIGDGNLIYLNNCNRGKPVETFSYAEFDRGMGREKHRGNIHRDKNRHYERLLGAIDTAKNVVVSYEVFPVDEATIDGLWNESGMAASSVQDIFILRSPLNLLASCIKRIDNETGRKARVPAKTREFLDDTFSQYLGYLKRFTSMPESCVIYDRWGSDLAYRSETLAHFGLEALDLDLGEMTTAGGGSSFDKEQDVASISTSKRWEQSLDNPLFTEAVRDIYTDAPLMEAIAKVFPEDHAQLVSMRDV